MKPVKAMNNTNLKVGTRRVFAQGAYSWVVTLPPIWVRHHKLERYSEVEMEIAHDGSLVIRPHTEKNK